MIDTTQPTPSKIPSWKYAEIERKVAELYEQQNIHSFPIDPFQIIKNLGYILVSFSQIDETMPFAFQDDENDAFSFFSPQDNTYIIVYDDKKPYERLRFTLMHELGHILLGHKSESDLAKRMADYFAGYALAPIPLIHCFAGKEPNKIRDVFLVSHYCAEVCSNRYSNWLAYGGIEFRGHEITLLSLFQDFENKV